MFKDDVFDKWLDKEANKVLDKVNKEGDTTITIEDKMILTLKAQTNHFYHLDIELREDIEKARKMASEELKAFREEQNKKWDEQNKKWDEQNKKWDENQRELRELKKEQNKKWNENQRELRELKEEQNKKWEEQNRKWDENQRELKDIRNEMNKIYQSINNQTWKMIGSVGLIVILGKVIDGL